MAMVQSKNLSTCMTATRSSHVKTLQPSKHQYCQFYFIED